MSRPHSQQSVWTLLDAARSMRDRFVADPRTRVTIADLAHGTSLTDAVETFRGRSVMIVTKGQLPAVLALCQLDGIAGRLLLCPPELNAATIQAILHQAQIDTVVTDGTGPVLQWPAAVRVVACGDTISATAEEPVRRIETEWVLLTSGTTGLPKLAVHSLAALTGPLRERSTSATSLVWSTFYDVRRYGGLQILLRALGSSGSMVLSDPDEAVSDFLDRAAQNGVSFISGTPSHWRRALMSERPSGFSPKYVRLSGEACDQAILDNLRHAYPGAEVVHAFASTEAGVAFEVRDGRAGFPAELIGATGPVALRVVDGSLRIRSDRTARCYLGSNTATLAEPDGFVDTGDVVERRGSRYYFAGRRQGIINVGGLKVHPEAVEAVINEHSAVQMSRVRGRANPITGAIVVADVVLDRSVNGANFSQIGEDIRAFCRRRLAPHEIPATFRHVPSLPIAASGKLVRQDA